MARPNPIQMMHDFNAKRRIKKGLLVRLAALRPGTNLSIEVENDPPTSRAIIELLVEHTEYEALSFGSSITLGRKVGFAGVMSPAAQAHLHAKGLAFGAEEARTMTDKFHNLSIPKPEKDVANG